MRSLLWFNLLRFCCWIAVLKSRQFKCHRIISVYEMRDGSDLWLWRHDDIVGFGDVTISRLWGGSGLSQRCHLASCDLWPSRQNEQRKASVSVANETSMHWENSGPKQAAWTQNEPPPHTHTHTNITPFKPIYKHYLYFVHTLTHAHTQRFTLSLK